MRLRGLELKDASFMLEWMHDESVVENMQANFKERTLEDCYQFIRTSADTTESVHLAIVNEFDEYMGTVSLKHIANGEAEFGIVVRACAMGKGYSQYGMDKIFCMGIEEYRLKRIYWCVNPDNRRAIRFYDKNGYQRVNTPNLKMGGGGGYSQKQINYYIWYQYETESGGKSFK